MINLYDSKEIDFTHNGILILSDCISCIITEELNGLFECTLEYPLLDSVSRVGVITPPQIVGRHKVGEQGISQIPPKWTYLLEGNIIKVDGQLYRIYHKAKTLSSIKVNAKHIFYDLLDNLLEDVRPTFLSGYGALDYILTRTQYAHNFTSSGDVGGSNTKYFVRTNPVNAIMGQDGIIATWGGEIKRDNFAISLLNARGADRGVLVAYGKNIQGIEETLDMDGLCTRLMPIGKDGLLLSEKCIDSPYINNFPHPKIKVQDFSDCEDEATLRAAATKYMLDSKIDIPQFNYKIDFLELSKTEEYKDYAVLETVYMGDTVTVKHSKLNINLKAKVIKIIKNVLTDRIDKIELGSFKPNLATTFNNAIQSVKKEIVQVRSDYQTAIDNATALITGSKGGNVVIRQGEDGKPYEILIMDTADVNTAVNVWRWNLGGFGYSSTGINGPYGTAITMDGHIIGSFITALEISGNQIKGGTLTLGGATYGNGVITLRNDANEVIGTIDKTGISTTADATIGQSLNMPIYTPHDITELTNILTQGSKGIRFGASNYKKAYIIAIDMQYMNNGTISNTANESIQLEVYASESLFLNSGGDITIHSYDGSPVLISGSGGLNVVGALTLYLGAVPYAITRDANGFLKAI